VIPSLTDLPTIDGGWPCILVDLPWSFKSNSIAKPGRNARRHYPTMALDEIMAIPVGEVAAKDCHLFLWATGSMLLQAVQVLYRWRFRYAAMGFVWIKLKRGNADRLFYSLDDLHVGLGLTTRHNAEFVLMAKKGHPKRLATNVREIILAPVREHSRKPDEIYQLIERYCDGPRLELFPGVPRAGWTQWGDPLKLAAE
jgi:N6-adenosine-specific RNA methylase IME4